MGKIKYISEIRKFLKKSPVVDIASLKRFIPKKNKEYIYTIINNLLRKKEIEKVTKGFYSVYDESSLLVFCFKPSYLGLQDALSFHNLWEQETNPVVITSRKIRTGIRVVFGRNAVVRRINKKYLFGFDYYKSGDFYLPYSDIEKTFIDLIYFREYLDKEVIKEFRKKIDMKKLKSYLKAYPKRTRERVLKVLRVNK